MIRDQGSNIIFDNKISNFCHKFDKILGHGQFTWGIGVWHDHSNIKINGGRIMARLFPEHYKV